MVIVLAAATGKASANARSTHPSFKTVLAWTPFGHTGASGSTHPLAVNLNHSGNNIATELLVGTGTMIAAVTNLTKPIFLWLKTKCCMAKDEKVTV